MAQRPVPSQGSGICSVKPKAMQHQRQGVSQRARGPGPTDASRTLTTAGQRDGQNGVGVAQVSQNWFKEGTLFPQCLPQEDGGLGEKGGQSVVASDPVSALMASFTSEITPS